MQIIRKNKKISAKIAISMRKTLEVWNSLNSSIKTEQRTKRIEISIWKKSIAKTLWRNPRRIEFSVMFEVVGKGDFTGLSYWIVMGIVSNCSGLFVLNSVGFGGLNYCFGKHDHNDFWLLLPF